MKKPLLGEQIARLPKAGGAYILLLRVQEDQACEIGRLGEFAIPAGYYAYVGSALGPGGLAARVGRHLRAGKRMHWHIDYLLAMATVEEVWAAASERRLECEWARRLLETPAVHVVVPRFGASDCTCPAHLIHWEALPPRKPLLSDLGIQWILRADAPFSLVYRPE